LDKLADFYHTSVDYLIYRTNVSTPYSKKVKLQPSSSEKSLDYSSL